MGNPFGGPSGSSGTGTGSTANVYTPTAQPAADQMYQNIVQGLYNAGPGPAGINYPTGQDFVDRLITGSPYASQALLGAQTAADYSGQFFPYQAGAGYNLIGGANNALPFANQAAAQAFNPLYQQIVDYTQQNPYFQTALSGADQAANIGGQWASLLQQPIGAGLQGASPLLGGAQQALDFGSQVMGAAPAINAAAQSIYGQADPIMRAAQGVNQNAGNVWSAANQVAATAFDPQNALFNRTQGQLLDQQGAINAMSGVAGTPYGAGVTGQTLSNFDIDWQDQLLARQQAGLGALNTGFGATQGGLGALGTGYNVLNQGLGALGLGQGALNLGAGAYNAGLGAYGGALGQYNNAISSALQNATGTANLGAQSAALPSATYINQLNNILASLKGQQSAAVTGAGAFGSLLNAAQGAYGQGANLQNNAVQQYLSGTQQPYNTGLGIANNALSGLTNVTNLGAQQYALPETLLNNLAAYLKLGQMASATSGSLGQMGFDQTATGLGGLLGGANALFGSPTGGLLGGGGTGGLLGGSGGLLSAGGLLGSQGPLFGTAADLSIASGGPPLAATAGLSA